MCLIVVGWRSHPDYPLVVAANRDEFFARPSSPIARWPDAPQVIGGLDLEAGGTWLGITESGRFAAVTNVREPGMAKGDCSRGTLTRDFLTANTSADNFAAQIDCRRYSGFNLLLGDGDSLVYYSNRDTPRAGWSPAFMAFPTICWTAHGQSCWRRASVLAKPCPACPTSRRFSNCWPTRSSSMTKICPLPAFPSNGKGCSRPSSSSRQITARGHQLLPGSALTEQFAFMNRASARTASRFSPR